MDNFTNKCIERVEKYSKIITEQSKRLGQWMDWDNLPHLHRPWIDEIKITCPKCGLSVDRIPQVGDVWLDAGIVPFSTLKYFEDREYWSEYFPAEFVIEMKEQIRLWFYSMLFMSTILTGEPPYEKVGTHGVVTAEDGSKFSKTGFMIKFDEAANNIGADASRYLFASNSTSSDVRFGYGLGDEAKRKLLSFWNLSVFFATYAELDNVKVDLELLDFTKLHSTDKWLVVKVNQFISDATKHMDEHLTRELIQKFEIIVDDVSNFYIRVNRRRFWKEGTTEDKINAYMSLFYAIKTITQIMAPIIPFITEHIWQEIIKRYSDGCVASVHLSDWPKEMYKINKCNSITNDVNCIRNIISLALKCRNEKQIKIRHPLSKIIINKNETTISAISTMKHILLSEINVYDVEFIEDISLIENYIVSIDFKLAGAILKGDVNKVNGLVKEFTKEDHNKVAKDVLNKKNIIIAAYDKELSYTIFTLNTKSKDNIVMAKENDLVIALDTVITDELYKEGLVRDILRQCQVIRKTAGFNVDDKIQIEVGVNSNDLQEIIDRNQEYLELELLAKFCTVNTPDFEQSIKIDCNEILIKIKKY